MFSSAKQLAYRKGKYGTSRLEHLQALVTEFQDTEDQGAKEQILANLANFAYDPINYENMRNLNIIDLFLDMLTEESETLVEFGMGGLCNCCIDPLNATTIIENKGVELIIKCLSSANEETVLSALTTLYYLSSEAKKEISAPVVIETLKLYSTCAIPRLRNASRILLDVLFLLKLFNINLKHEIYFRSSTTS
eukprot:TRINITY_DN9217_c0_g1_i1.p1 TRINITY_DN9217_c0_g1~~TRINITY_DN9217_c0_g1_i1.p1  ORF type:complete len:193 (-),score=32.39 TRINITY_DN9217_c0_g1_i1:212-790(-)